MMAWRDGVELLRAALRKGRHELLTLLLVAVLAVGNGGGRITLPIPGLDEYLAVAR